MKYTINGKILREYQRHVYSEMLSGRKRHAFLVLPRRSGKSMMTFYVVNAGINKYYLDTRKPCNATFLAPLQKQCREIYVNNILDDGRKLFDISNARFTSSRLELNYNFGSTAKFAGSDKIDSKMGAGNRYIVLDEHAMGRPEVFQRMFPMIQYNGGSMIVTTTPRGKNHSWQLFEQVKNDSDWLVMHEDVFSLGLMTQEEYEKIPMDENYKRQEFLCSWDSPFQNAIYSQPNICANELDTMYPVYISFDLGIKDLTSIIIAQNIDNQIKIRKTIEAVNTSLEQSCEQLIDYLRSNNLRCRWLFLPHDGNERDLITGRSRYDYVQSLGFNTQIVQRRGLMDGIDIVRRNWHRIFFNEGDISIERVKGYVMDQQTYEPKHDINSHTADALRYLVVGIENDKGIVVPTNYEQHYRHNIYQRSI